MAAQRLGSCRYTQDGETSFEEIQISAKGG